MTEQTIKCDGCDRHCTLRAKLFKMHGTDFYMPTINETPTEFHTPLKTQAFFMTIEACIKHAIKVTETRCIRHYKNKSR